MGADGRQASRAVRGPNLKRTLGQADDFTRGGPAQEVICTGLSSHLTGWGRRCCPGIRGPGFCLGLTPPLCDSGGSSSPLGTRFSTCSVESLEPKLSPSSKC